MQGWDKTYCLRYVKDDFDEIHFFGDKTFKACLPGRPPPRGHRRHPASQQNMWLLLPAPLLQGGNDFEIFESELTVGHTVTGPADTIRQLRELFPAAA